MFLSKLLQKPLKISGLLLATVLSGTAFAESPPSAQRAMPDLNKRIDAMENHYASGRYTPALATGMRMCMQEGVVRACAVAGEILERGLGGPANPKKAADLYKRACVEKDKEMCLRAADIYAALVAKEPVEDGLPEDEWIAFSKSDAANGARAAYYYACELGDANLCHTEAVIHQLRLEGKAALRALDKGCESGLAKSCISYAHLISMGLQGPEGFVGNPKDTRVNVYYRKACSFGDKEACNKAK